MIILKVLAILLFKLSLLMLQVENICLFVLFLCTWLRLPTVNKSSK